MSNDSCAEREEGETPRTLSAAEVSGSRRCWQGLSARESAPGLLGQRSVCRCHPTSSRSRAGSCPPARQTQLNRSKKMSLGFGPATLTWVLVRGKCWEEMRCPIWWEVPRGGCEIRSWSAAISEAFGQTAILNVSQKLQKYLLISGCDFYGGSYVKANTEV